MSTPAVPPILEAFTPAPAAAVASALVVGLVLAVACGPILRRWPEPATQEPKTPYAALATRGFAAAVGAAASAAVLIVVTTTPPHLWAAWASLAVVNVMACAIDARTTWLPARLSQVGWAVAALGAIIAGLSTASWLPVAAAAAGALVVGGFFHLLWRITAALGYGDVRLAATIGAVTALTSPLLVGAALLAGTLLSALVGIALHLAGRRGGFPYGPGLLAGPFVALLLPAGVSGGAVG